MSSSSTISFFFPVAVSSLLLTSRRVAFSFLEDIKKRFSMQFGDRGRTALAYAMNEEFSRVLAKQMEVPSVHHCTPSLCLATARQTD